MGDLFNYAKHSYSHMNAPFRLHLYAHIQLYTEYVIICIDIFKRVLHYLIIKRFAMDP
jgi:hypothetical protein